MNPHNTSDQSNWYAIYTNPRAEKKVYERLCLKGYTAYLPLVTSIRTWSDRKKKVSVPLIAGYVFVNIDKERLFETMNIQGTLGILRYLGKPAVIRDNEIQNLKILMNDSEQLSQLKNIQYEKGEEVEVINGPFKGLKGQYVNVQGKHRVVIEIEAIGSVLAVNVPGEFVSRIICPNAVL